MSFLDKLNNISSLLTQLADERGELSRMFAEKLSWRHGCEVHNIEKSCDLAQSLEKDIIKSEKAIHHIKEAINKGFEKLADELEKSPP